jgi:hypothetical protein
MENKKADRQAEVNTRTTTLADWWGPCPSPFPLQTNLIYKPYQKARVLSGALLTPPQAFTTNK